jgi:hypothetical protein
LFSYVLAAGLCVCALSASGCSRVSEAYLTQPQLNRWQQNIHLRSQQVYWAAEPGSERVLAEFPLPGATTGKPMYLLYLRLPPGQGELAFTANEPCETRGFFIQIRGRYAGLAFITAGKITVEGKSQSPEASRQIRIELICDDGSRLNGLLIARKNDWQLTHFENQRRPGDVQALLHLTSAPAGKN